LAQVIHWARDEKINSWSQEVDVPDHTTSKLGTIFDLFGRIDFLDINMYLILTVRLSGVSNK